MSTAQIRVSGWYLGSSTLNGAAAFVRSADGSTIRVVRCHPTLCSYAVLSSNLGAPPYLHFEGQGKTLLPDSNRGLQVETRVEVLPYKNHQTSVLESAIIEPPALMSVVQKWLTNGCAKAYGESRESRLPFGTFR